MRIIALALLVLPLNCLAETDWVKASLSFIDNAVVPATAQFVDSSRHLYHVAIQYCSNKGSKSEINEAHKELIQAYHQAADAWQGIQIYRTGPAQAFMRHSRIEMWPVISRISSKQIQQLLVAEDKQALEMDKFSKSSTAVQGLPALERLLFGSATSPASIQAGNYACELTQVIALNLLSIGEDMLNEWQTSYKQQIQTLGQPDSYLSSGEDLASEFLTDFYTQLDVIIEQKLGRPYSKNRFRLKRAESWRSQRSIRNIKINIDAAGTYYRELFSPTIKATSLNERILSSFASVKGIGEALDDGFAAAQDKSADDIQMWRQELIQMRELIQSEIPGMLGVTIGFNALDGDG